MEIFARLAERGYRREEILTLDPWFVRNVIFYPREDNGDFTPRPTPDAPPDSLTAAQAFRVIHKRRGFPDWKIDELWEAICNARPPSLS